MAQHQGQQLRVTVGTVEEGRAVVGLGSVAAANPGRQSSRELAQQAEGGCHHVVLLRDRATTILASRSMTAAKPSGPSWSRSSRPAAGSASTAARISRRRVAVVGPRQQLGVEVEQQRHELVDPRERIEGGGGTGVRIVHDRPGRSRPPMVEGNGVADRDGSVGRVEGARRDGHQARLPGRHHTDGPAPALGRVARLGLPTAHRRGLGDRRGEGPSRRRDAPGVVAEEAAHRSGTGDRSWRQRQALELTGLVVESHGGTAQTVDGLVDQAVDGGHPPGRRPRSARTRCRRLLRKQRTQLGALHHGCEAADRPRSALQLAGLHDRDPTRPPSGGPSPSWRRCVPERDRIGRAR